MIPGKEIMEQIAIVSIEPSTRLSELCGFPYFIERRFTIKELLEKGAIDEGDVKEMEQGNKIYKKLTVK